MSQQQTHSSFERESSGEVAFVLAELLCVAAVYACAVLYAHWVARHRNEAAQRHYVLVANNHQSQIEWYMRALQMYSRRTGTDIQITVLLQDSSDETGPIVRKLARSGAGIEWEDAVNGRERWRADVSRLVWVELSKTEDLERLPI